MGAALSCPQLAAERPNASARSASLQDVSKQTRCVPLRQVCLCVCVKNIDSFVGLTSQRGVSAFADSKGNMWCSHRARCSYRRDVCVVASRLLCPADLVRQSTSWASVSEFRCEEHSFPASPTETRRSLTKLRSHLGVGTGRSS